MPEKSKKQTLQINIFLEIFPNYFKQKKKHPNNCCCFKGHATDYENKIIKNNIEFPFLLVLSLIVY